MAGGQHFLTRWGEVVYEWKCRGGPTARSIGSGIAHHKHRGSQLHARAEQRNPRAENHPSDTAMNHSDKHTLINPGRKAGLNTQDIYAALTSQPHEGSDTALGQSAGNGYR